MLRQATQVQLDKLFATFDVIHQLSLPPLNNLAEVPKVIPLDALPTGPELPPSLRFGTMLGAILLPPHLQE